MERKMERKKCIGICNPIWHAISCPLNPNNTRTDKCHIYVGLIIII